MQSGGQVSAIAQPLTVRLGKVPALTADHFMKTREMEPFDLCLKAGAMASKVGITESEIDELERKVNAALNLPCPSYIYVANSRLDPLDMNEILDAQVQTGHQSDGQDHRSSNSYPSTSSMFPSSRDTRSSKNRFSSE